MAIQFIRSNPADDSWDRMQQRLDRQRERRQAEGLDEALRGGVQEMYGRREGMANEQPFDRRPPAGLSGVRAAPEPQQPTSSNFDRQPTRSPDRARELTGLEPQRARASTDVSDLWSLVEQRESGGRQFDANGQPLTSSAGAIGVAQVMPGTAPEAARMAGLEWDENRYRTDEDYNRSLGQAYLGNRLEQFGEDALALAAYNAGAGRVEQWLNQFGDPRTGEISVEEWVQQIPFDETRNYVSGILAQRSGQQAQQPQQRGGLSAIQAQPQQPQGGAYDPVIERLMQTPGGGQAAFQLYQGQQQSAAEAQQARAEQYNSLVENAMTALANDNVEAFQFYGQQAGILDQFPPQVLQDANMRRLIGQGSLLAESIYAADDEQGGVFMQAYLQSGGNAQQAFLAAGRPQSRPNYDLRELMTDEGAVFARIDQRAGTAEPITMGGGNLARPTVSGSDMPAEARMHQYWMDLGYDQDEATRLVTQSKFDPRGTAARTADAMVRAEINRLQNPLDPGQAPARYEELFTQILSIIESSQTGGQEPMQPQPTITPDYTVSPEELR